MDLKELEKLLSELKIINEKYEDEYKKSGEKLNIFSLLKAETEEVKTHSRFIAELLNPNGIHGQGLLFLKLFIETLGIAYFDYNNVQVKVEYTIGEKTDTSGGRIDIIIKNNSFAIIIENKIYACDQQNQLLRYYKYGEDRFENRYKLLYLTLDGKEATDESKGKNNEIKYECISYKYHILNWLQTCIDITNNCYLKNLIKQYLNLVKKLTFQNMNNEQKRELYKIISENNNYFNLIYSYRITEEFFREIEKNFWETIWVELCSIDEPKKYYIDGSNKSNIKKEDIIGDIKSIFKNHGIRICYKINENTYLNCWFNIWYGLSIIYYIEGNLEVKLDKKINECIKNNNELYEVTYSDYNERKIVKIYPWELFKNEKYHFQFYFDNSYNQNSIMGNEEIFTNYLKNEKFVIVEELVDEVLKFNKQILEKLK